jgi:hypothetical protein
MEKGSLSAEMLRRVLKTNTRLDLNFIIAAAMLSGGTRISNGFKIICATTRPAPGVGV